jgi:hypothetical protein
MALRGPSMICADDRVAELTGLLFDGLREYFKRAALLGREPA